MFVFACLSCASEIFIDLPEEPPRLVAVCHFTDGDLFRVRLSFSQNYDEPSPLPPPEDADVTIAVGGQSMQRLRRVRGPNGDYIWEGLRPAESGINYTLAVKVQGYPRIEATSAVPAHRPLAAYNGGNGMVQYTQMQDGMRLARVPISLRPAEMPPDRRFFAFNLQYELEVFEQLPNGQIIVDYTYVTGPRESSFTSDGRTIALLSDLTRLYEPLILVNEKFWNSPDASVNIDALIRYNPRFERPVNVFVEWRTLSPEYYWYFLSLASQGSTPPLAEPDAVFNNVLNGYGNFSGYAFSIDTIRLDL
mgnify:CR=1 FL=1